MGDKEDLTLCFVRQDRKKWLYLNHEPSSVEIAVLKYFKDHGWSGYFTQNYNYFALCVLVIGWSMFSEKCVAKNKKDRSRYFSNLKQSFFYGANSIFENCRDGLLQKFDADYDEIYKYFCEYDIGRFPNDLSVFMQENIRSFDIARYNINCGVSSEITADEVVSFFNRFSKMGILQYIDKFFPKERVYAMRRLDNFDKKFWDWHKSFKRANFEDFNGEFRRCVNPLAVKNGIGMHFLFQPSFHYGGGFENNISKVRSFAEYVVCPDVKSEILRECEFAEFWRSYLLKMRETTILDLQLWREDADMIVEVKAPNDRLSSSQKNTITRCRENGGVALLVKVVESDLHE